ncbi:MAG: hypothetical protein SCM96_10765 [Acidobacteriota bacterium]|nr:hypothetical protein [Acidobacteriota bacterium]
MYLDDLAARIRGHVPEDRIPDADSDSLFRLYAVLLRAKGANVTQSDVHDAWSAWMAKRDGAHASLVAYGDLSEEVRKEDQVFTTAIHKAADQLDQAGASRPSFSEILFPSGPPTTDVETRQALDLYKIMVDSSESLVSRRQAVNTFFLTMNGALLTASGIIVQSSGGSRLGGVGIAVLAVAGAILCAAWRSLITSFGQLNRGKFQVINTIERYLKAAIYAAEWEALSRGEDPKVYRSFTSREIWVPNALLVLHILTALGAVLFASGFFH